MDQFMLGQNVKRLGAEVIADMLAGYGVTHVFMVPAVLRRTFAEMEKRTSIAHIHCHGEKSAAYRRTAMRARRASPASAWRR
jgi:acetolactate synthase-1/2/3 large subunit